MSRYPKKEEFSSRINHTKYKRQHETIQEKRQSVFDRLGSKGSIGVKSSQKYPVQNKKNRGESSSSRREISSKPKNKQRSPISSDGTSSGVQSTSSSRSSSTSGTSSTSTTSSSSSAPSVKLRLKKQKRTEKLRSNSFERTQNNIVNNNNHHRHSPLPPPRRTSGEDRKNTTRYDSSSSNRMHNQNQLRRKTPTPDPYNRRGMNERIRIVPPSPGPSGSGNMRFINPKNKQRTDNRNYQDFRNIDQDKRMRERLAPARTPPIRDRIPPLLPDMDRRRPPPPQFLHQDSNKGFNFKRRQTCLHDRRPPREPMLPVRNFQDKKLFEELKPLVVEPKSLVKTDPHPPPPPPPQTIIDDVLSEISEDEDELSTLVEEKTKEKEEVEVSSTLVDDVGVVGGDIIIGVSGVGESGGDDSILENMDFEEISDEEFEDGKKSRGDNNIVDALCVDWSILFQSKEISKPKQEKRKSRLVDIFKNTGLKKGLVDDEIYSQILECGIRENELENPLSEFKLKLNENCVERIGLGGGSSAISTKRDLALRRYFLGFDEMPLDSYDDLIPNSHQINPKSPP